jgi:type II secretory pathway component PulF
MPEYVYRAITKEGVIVKNRVESGNKQTLVKRLKEGNLTPIDVVQIGYGRKKVNVKKRNVTDIDEIMKTANSSSVIQGRGRKKQSVIEKVNLAISKQEKVTTRDIMVFTQNFYLLKKADFNNIHALSTIIESTENLTFRGVLEDILAGLEAGEYMYTTMEYYENIFPYIYINMIKVGELSGSLTQSLQQAVKYLDTSTDTSKKLKKIIIGTKDTLPAITIAFSHVIEWIAAHWYVPTGIIAVIVGIIFAYINTPKGKYNFDYFKYTMPIFGKLNYTMDYSRLMRAMLLNLENGMRIQDALDVSKNVVSNFVMRAMVETSINNILVGTSWIEPFEKAGLGSTMITEMLKVGMQTDLSAMMEKLLEYMDVDIKNTMDKIMAVLPQLVYSIVGVLLIFVVVVVLVPCIQVYMGTFMFSAAGV